MIVARDLPNVNIPCDIVYNPHIKDYGRTIYEEVFPGYNRVLRIEIGPQKLPTDEELRDTIIHEILEAKIIARDDRRLEFGDPVIHPYIDKIIAKYIKMKRL